MPVLVMNILLAFFCIAPVMAEEMPVVVATDHLEATLTDFKESIAQMSSANDALDLKNQGVRAKINQLQSELDQSLKQEQELSQDVLKLQQNNDARGQQIARMEKEILDTDAQAAALDQGAQATNERLAGMRLEDQQLSDQITQMQGTMPQQALPDNDQRKEKLKLIKMIYESKEHQGQIQRQLLQLKKESPPSIASQEQERQDQLKKDIAQIEAEVNQAQPPKANTFAYTEEDLQALEGELDKVQKNYDQLQSLFAQMKEKVQAVQQISPKQRQEQQKLQSSVDDLTRESKSLRLDMDELRVQMVELDKRKARLEALLRH